jgi:AcrR family transcriptional regulator
LRRQGHSEENGDTGKGKEEAQRTMAENKKPARRHGTGSVGKETDGGKATRTSPRRRRSLEPRQERSRESERKLMKAAAEVLGQHGVEGATIPRIAAHAGLTPGAVYRRFQDKDSLLEAAVLEILERQNELLRTGPSTESMGQIPLPVLAENLVHSLLVGFRTNAGLLQAIRRLAQESRNEHFRKKVGRLERRTRERIVQMVVASAGEISHPTPRMAASLGLAMVFGTLRELLLPPSNVSAWKGLVPQDDVTLRRELTRAFLSYLGAPVK